MTHTVPLATRRAWVVASYISPVVFLICFSIVQQRNFHPAAIVLGLISLATVFTSLVQLHVRTGLWRMVHRSFDELDERQIQVVLRALRYSYVTFAVLTLATLLLGLFVYRGNTSLGMFILWCLIYVAHTLPASLIAWTEKEV
jgi:hypothetical protein